MLRFVILEHDHPALHWDFMLEAGEVLRTWRLAGTPEPGRVLAAEPLPDHRRLYLDYEGPVSDGRGTVRRWDAGTFDVEAETDGRLVLRLRGGRGEGQAVLERTEAGDWQFVFQPGGEVGA